MTFSDFLDKWNNKFCEVVDPSSPNQCFDLFVAWLDALAIPRTVAIHLYAYQIYSQPNDDTVKYFELVPNTPNGIPQQGDIVVWDKTYGGAGHVGVATGRSDTNSFDCFEQNDPIGSKCHVKTYGYDLVLGWLRLRGPQVGPDSIAVLKTDFENLVNKSTKFDSFVSGGYNSIDDVKLKVEALQGALQKATDDSTILTAQVDDLNQKLKECQDSTSPSPVPEHTEFKLFGLTLWVLKT